MSIVNKILLIFVAILISNNALSKGRLLVGGSGWNKIAMINKETKLPYWIFQIPNGGECNSVTYTKAGNIAFSFSKGAAVVNQNANILFTYQAKPGEEVQSITEIRKGYLLGICGTPSRIIELSKYGEVKKEITYDTGIKNAHSQHRQIRKTKKGTYLVPLVGGGKILEIDSEGEIIREVKVEGSPFSISELSNGNWLIPCGDAGFVIEINPNTGEVVEKIDSETIGGGIKLGFVAETIRFKNGNTLICNWLGHGGDKSQPILIELNSENKVVWQLENGTPDVGLVSAVHLIK